jgi:biotin carboxyl carrier protein
MKYFVQVEDKTHEVEIIEQDGSLQVSLDGKPVQVDSVHIKGKNFVSLLFNNRSFDLEFYKNKGKTSVFLGGKRYECTLEDERTQKLKQLGVLKIDTKRENELRSPMPGLVTAIEAKEGDMVAAGQGVIIIEAMKMENELKAPIDGKVKEIKVKKHQPVDKNDLLIVFE